jgi:putative colanic acid biosynthesis glycosyltransferase
MPKLFQICVEGNTGSTGRIAEGLGTFVIQNGWDSYIAHGRFTRPSKSRLLRIGTNFEVLLHGLQTRIFDRHCLGSKWATKRLISKIKEIKPDVIHLHHLHGYYINIEVLFNFLSEEKVPVIWTFHDCWSVTGHCAHFDFIGCNKWKEQCHHCPQTREYPSSLIFDRSRKNFNLKKSLFNSLKYLTIVSVSYWLDSVVRESFLKAIPQKVIYNGIDLNVFKPFEDTQETKIKFGVGNKFMILGVASQWDNRKGLKDFITLSKILEPDMIILLIGLTKKQIKNLPKNIIGFGRTENQFELTKLYSAAEVFVNLSVEETFGLTTAEALSCGTPAIVYDSTACPEVIDKNTGIVVAKGDIIGVKNSIEIIRTNGKSFYSSECRKRVISKFNKEDRYSEYFDLYKTLKSMS